MTTPLKLAIGGVAGRMGRQLVSAALTAGHQVTGGTEAQASPALSTDIGTLAGRARLGVEPQVNIANAAAGAQIWIDFTRPNVTLETLAALAQTQVRAVIIGTTGFSAEALASIHAAADRFAIVQAGNFSLGIALLTRLTALAAEHLPESWDIEVLETHHRHKVDAPSGTALMLGEAAAGGRGETLETLRSPPYDGANAARKEGEIGFAVRRAGGVIGAHEVTLTSQTEQITLSHMALDRQVFADGAIRAAEWARTQPAGLYTIYDVLGL